MKFKHFLNSLLELMFSNTTSDTLCHFYIIFSFLQIAGYIFKLNYTILSDSKLLFFLQLLYYCNFSNLLFFISSTLFTYISFIILAILLHFLLFFPIVFFFLTKNLKISQTNVFIQFFSLIFKKLFESFIWILLTPTIEFCMNITDCEDFSYIAENRNNSQCQIPIILWVATVWICVVSFIISFLYIWTYTDNTFLDMRSIKMKFTIYSFSAFLSKFSFIIVFPLIYNKTPALIYIYLHIIAIMTFIDYVIYFPIRNQALNKKYIIYLCCMESFFIIMSFWAFNVMSETELFYVLIILLSLCFKLAGKIHDLLYMKIIISNLQNFDHFNYLLEETLYLLGNFNFSDKQCLLLGLFRKHIKYCKEIKCKFAEKHMKIFENSNEIKRLKLLNEFIQQKYQITILHLHKTHKYDKSKLESLLLKYTSFLSIYNPNPLKAFYEIQRIMQKHENPSFLFLCYRNILSKVTKNAIYLKDKELRFSGQRSSTISDKDLEVNDFIHIMKEKAMFENESMSILNAKVAFWNRYKDGFQSYNEVINEVKLLVNKIQVFQKKLNERLEHVYENKSRGLFAYKFLSIIHCILYNNINQGIKYEEEVEATKKREYCNEKGILGYLSFFEDNVIPIKVSFLAHKGAILEESKNHKITDFFQYEKDELKNLNLLDLMPNIISEYHDRFFAWQLSKSLEQRKTMKKYIDSYAKLKNGLIFPIKIYIGYGFEHKQDFVMQGLVSENNTYLDENIKTLIFDDKGIIHGIDKGFYTIISKEFPRIESSNINFLNIFNIIPGLVDILTKNDAFNKKINVFIRNLCTLMVFPKNLLEILEILKIKHKEENEHTNKLSYYSGMTMKTEKSKKSSRPESNRSVNEKSSRSKSMDNNNININNDKKSSNKNKKQFLTLLYNTKPDITVDKRSLLEEKSNREQLTNKEISDELIERTNCLRFKIYFDIKVHYYYYGEKENQNVCLFAIKISKIRPILSGQSLNDPSKLSYSLLKVDNAFKEGEMEIEEVQSSFIRMPPENIASFRQTPFIQAEPLSTIRPNIDTQEKQIEEDISKNSIQMIENQQDLQLYNTRMLTTTQNLLTVQDNINNNLTLRSNSDNKIDEISKEESVHESQQAKNIEELKKNSTDMIKIIDMKSQKASSISSNKKAFSIYNSIDMIQNYIPNNIKRLEISIIIELIIIVIFCIMVYTFSVQYINNYYDPLQSALEDFSQMTTAFSTVTLASVQIELYQKGYVIVGSDDSEILLKIISESFALLKKFSNTQRNLDSNFNYQIFFKSTIIKNTETTFYTTTNANFLDVLDTIISNLGDVVNQNFDSENQKIFEYFPINFGYVIDNFNNILDSITLDFGNSNQNTSKNILIIMLIFVILIIPLKLFQFKQMQIFYRELIRMLNIFLRVSQKAAFNEFLFQKELLQTSFDLEKKKLSLYKFFRVRNF